MCGILTVIQKAGGVLDLRACRRALSRLSWRGPDLCVSTIWQDRVFVGQTVLSLTGTIGDSSGRYARSASGRFVVAFNGEIYNFRYLAERFLAGHLSLSPQLTDTEVLVNLHDVMSPEEIPDHLDGMYSYTVLDETAQQLHVVRDVQGEKSLYIYEDAGIVVIASEIPAILALVPGIQLDTQSFRDYFRTRHFMLFSRTPYRGIRQILPGQVERHNLGDERWVVSRHRKLLDWIDPARLEANSIRTNGSLADELDGLLRRCVREMLPEGRRYAAVVSGGVDSSLLAHYLVAIGNPDVLVAVDHIGKDRISSDLSGFEQALGRQIDVLHIDEVPYAGEIVRCQRTSGTPLLAHSFVAQALQSAHVRTKNCRVMFGGEGGDELFGGYDAYLGDVGEFYNLSPSPYMKYETPEVQFESDDPSALRNDLEVAWQQSMQAYASISDHRAHTALAMMYGDAAYQLPAVGLRGADLMSMMWSVETRSVLLRKPIVEFALNLPFSAKVDPTVNDSNCRTKVLLKSLFLRYYPSSLLVKKQGFAGFPNESAAYLGDPGDYLAFDVLGIKRPLAMTQYSKATMWKLANIEYFLRSRCN